MTAAWNTVLIIPKGPSRALPAPARSIGDLHEVTSASVEASGHAQFSLPRPDLPGAYRHMSSVYGLPTLTPPGEGSPVKFPIAPHATAGSYFDAYADEISRAGKTIEPAALDHAAALLLEAYERGARAFSCGNGGSASIANHMQCDHVKGVRTSTDLTPHVLSLSTNVELVTAVANDLGYENVFVYQLQSQAEPGDVLIAVSSSGRSPNIVKALTWARDHGLRTIAVTGFDGGASRTVAEVSIHVDSTNYGVIEDLHQAIMHALAQYIRQSRMSADVISASVF
jgi:phosphoheptose isomerase